MIWEYAYTVPKVIDFPRYNTKCSGENKIQGAIFRVVYRFPLHFVLYLGNLDYFSGRVKDGKLHNKESV